MTSRSEVLLALDVGGGRIGVASADTDVKLASPLDTILVDGTEVQRIGEHVQALHPAAIVVGYPRNQAGEPTTQTAVVEEFSKQLEQFAVPVVFQDESLTSVIAEQRLVARKKPYTKAMIDAEAATIILQDYIEATYGY